jgi:glucose-1-phosphatase
VLYRIILVTHKIKNLIFDLGGVIIDLDVSRTHQKFAQLARSTAKDLKEKTSAEPFFNEYEKGLLSDDQFRASLRSFLNCLATDSEIDEAWNAMLITIAAEKYALLQTLKNNYRVILLSNTNNIHLKDVNRIVNEDTGRPSLDYFFHKTYYSHLIKMRKPEPEIFKHVLMENNLIESETLFLDDNLENIQSAGALGIQTAHVTSSSMVLSLFA